MSLQVNQEAPDFTLFTDDMAPFRLSDHRGKPTLLLFFPGAFTSVCTDELNAVNNELDALGGDAIQVAGVSTDSPFVLSEFSDVNHFSFPLLSDHDAEVSAAYGAKYNNDFTDMKLDRIAKRAAFVIDDEGVIRYAEVLDNAGKMPDFAAIQATIKSLV